MTLQERLSSARMLRKDEKLGLFAIWPGGTRIFLYGQDGSLQSERVLPDAPWAEQPTRIEAELVSLLNDGLPF